MDDDAMAALRDELADTRAALEQQARELAQVRAGLNLLVDILVVRGDLGKGHPALLERVQRGARVAEKRTVHLGIYEDKYVVNGTEIDCPSMLHLCKARCCTFSVALTRQDLDEGQVRWEIEEPYLLRHDRDGYCAHLDRASGGCTTYEHRPGTCRAYDCREDRRVWLDFANRVTAPLPIRIAPIR